MGTTSGRRDRRACRDRHEAEEPTQDGSGVQPSRHREPGRGGHAADPRRPGVRPASDGIDLRTIALHTAAERRAMFVREADEAVCLDDLPGRVDGAPGQPVPRPRRARAGARARRGPTPCGRAGGSSPSTPRSPSCCDRLGITFIGPSAGRDAPAGRQDRRQAARRGGRACRWRRGAAGRSTSVEDARAPGARPSATRSSSRRRPAAAAAASGSSTSEADLPAAFDSAAGRGPQGVRRRHRLHGAPGHRRPPRRGAGHRRRARHRLGRSACATARSSAATRR